MDRFIGRAVMRTVVSQIQVRARDNYLPELPSDGFGEDSARVTGGFEDEALEAGAGAETGFNTEALDGGRIGGLTGVTSVFSSMLNDTFLFDLVGGSRSAPLPLEEPEDSARGRAGEELAMAWEDGALRADFLPRGMKGVDDWGRIGVAFERSGVEAFNCSDCSLDFLISSTAEAFSLACRLASSSRTRSVSSTLAFSCSSFTASCSPL